MERWRTSDGAYLDSVGSVPNVIDTVTSHLLCLGFQGSAFAQLRAD